jgi:hypothetical protein
MATGKRAPPVSVRHEPQRKLLPKSASAAGFVLLEWKPFAGSSGSLLGTATEQQPSEQIVYDVPAFRKADGSVSVGLPSKPLVSSDGIQLRDADGRKRYTKTVDFASASARSRWAAAIAALLEAAGIGGDA